MLKCEKCIHKKICIDGANYKNAETCRNFVNENDAAPVKHGHWIDKPYPNYPAHDIKYCRECGWNIHKSKLRNSDLNWNYCPNCGAKMDGGDENAN